MSQSRLRAVLFDLDDTLLDWSAFEGDWRTIERAHLNGVCDFLEASGRPLRSSLNYLEEAFGTRMREAWADARTTLRAPHVGQVLLNALTACGYKDDSSIPLEDILAAYNWGPVPGVTLFEDVPPVLEQLIERGVTIGIVTNAAQPMLLRDAELDAFGLLPYFPRQELRIAAADVGYLKPSERIFLHALEAARVPPETAVYVGDNPVADIVGSQAVGMKGVLRRRNPPLQLSESLVTPDAIIDTLAELPDLFDEWFPGW